MQQRLAVDALRRITTDETRCDGSRATAGERDDSECGNTEPRKIGLGCPAGKMTACGLLQQRFDRSIC